MSSDVKRTLERGAGRPSRPLDLAKVQRRAGTLRTRRGVMLSTTVLAITGIAYGAFTLLPSRVAPDDRVDLPITKDADGAIVEAMSEQERAEVFSFRALAETGLMKPFDERTYLWTYHDDTTAHGAGWRIGYAASECSPQTCRGLSGEDPDKGLALTDTYVIVELRDGRWKVVGVEGNMLEDERERVIGYSLPDRNEPSHWEFPAVSVDNRDKGLGVVMFPVWIGPYPTEALGSVCTMQAFSEDGSPVGQEGVFYQEAPQREFERGGWVAGRGLDSAAGAASVDVDCRQYAGLGWEVASEPTMAGPSGEVRGVLIKLVWRGEQGFTTGARCRATLLNEQDEVVWDKSASVVPLWRPGELKDYPYETQVFIDAGPEPVDAQRVGEYSCRMI